MQREGKLKAWRKDRHSKQKRLRQGSANGRTEIRIWLTGMPNSRPCSRRGLCWGTPSGASNEVCRLLHAFFPAHSKPQGRELSTKKTLSE